MNIFIALAPPAPGPPLAVKKSPPPARTILGQRGARATIPSDGVDREPGAGGAPAGQRASAAWRRKTQELL